MSQILTNIQPDDRLAHRITDAAVFAGLSPNASQLAVRHEPIVALRLDPQNPRLHSRKQLRQIANSIKSCGFNVPVLYPWALGRGRRLKLRREPHIVKSAVHACQRRSRGPGQCGRGQAGTAPHKVSPGWDFREGRQIPCSGDSNSLLGIKFGSKIPCKTA
jgi:hypothetical protein